MMPGAGTARSHEWYPRACCSGRDCAPVVRTLPAIGGKWVTSAHGTVFVPRGFVPQPFRDADAHVCMRPDDHSPGKMLLLCFFEPGIF
jgi:hypothetical protein